MRVPRRAHVSLALTALAVWAATLCKTSLGATQEALRTALSLNDAQIGMLQGPALALPFVFLSIPVGALIDRAGRVRCLRLFGLLASAASMLSAFSTGYWQLLVTRCVVGLAAMSVLTASLSFTAELYAPDERGRAATVVALGQVFGMAGAFALGGLAFQWETHRNAGWQFSQLSLTLLSSAVLLCTFALREVNPTSSLVIRRMGHFRSVLAVWQYRKSLGPLICGIVMVAVADGAVLVWAAPFLSRTFSYQPADVGVTIAVIVAASGIIGPLLGGFLADHCQRRGGPALTLQALAAVTFLSVPSGFFALATHAGLAKALLFTLVLAGNVVGVAATPLSTIVVPPELRGTVIALMFAAGAAFGTAIAPVLVGVASTLLPGPQRLGNSLAILSVSTSTLAAIAFLLGGRHLSRHPT